MSNTVVESPRRQLERILFLRGVGVGVRVVRGFDAGSACHAGFTPGVRVEERENPRHTGVVRANVWGTVRVRWDNGWIEDVEPSEIRSERSK